MKEQIKNYFNRYVAFNEEEINEFYRHLKSKTYQKKDYLLKIGQVCKYKFFVSEGLTRTFYVDNNGKEQLSQFAIENWWVTNTESFIKESPSKLNIQALEETRVLMISKVDLEQLYVSIPKLEKLFRIVTENMLIAIQRKNEFYMKLSGKEKYDSLVKGIPDIIQRVPQYMIASYLEMTPEHLSAIRKNS